MKINEKIKELRKKNNLTQKEMAKKLGVSLSSLQKYEYGDFYPSIEVIKKIVDFFKITLNEFLDVSDISNEEKEIINWNINRSRELEKEIENDIEENTKNIEILLDDKEILYNYSDIVYHMSIMNFYFKVNKEKKEVNIEFYNDLKFVNDKGIYNITLTIDEFKIFLSYIDGILKLNILSALMLKAKKSD